LAARKAGNTYPQIQQQEKENGKTIPLATLQTTVRRDSSRTSGISKARSGMPQKISDEEKKKIGRILIKTLSVQ
jgi:hypothetical protein